METAKDARRRAMKKNALFEVEVSEGVFQTVNMLEHLTHDKQGHEFFACKGNDAEYKSFAMQGEFMRSITGTTFHIDHLVPLSRRGDHCPEN